MTGEPPPKDMEIGQEDLARVIVGSPTKALTGYMHPWYAESFRGFGRPRELPRCGGWILEREVPGFPYLDAMGCYPLFFCQDWSQLYLDLEEIAGDLVSLSMVADPWGEYDTIYLRQCFPDVFLPFKEHFVVDLRRPIESFVRRDQRKRARRASKHVLVERCEDPKLFLADWMSLYSNLIQRYRITGIRVFSEYAFSKQMRIPGMVAFRAVHEGTTVAMHLWYTHGDIGYSHLRAESKLGYQFSASAALLWSAIEYFAASGLRWLNLGAGAGTRSGVKSSLTQHKEGWSTGTRTAYFCGRILDQEAYWSIVKAKGISATDYFPAYRESEFG